MNIWLPSHQPSYGFVAGVRFDELSLIEFHWTRARKQLTVEELSDRGDAILEKVTVNQFHGDFTREFVLDEQHWLRPFLTGSVGAVHLAGSSKSFTRFSFGLETGLKLFPHSRFGVRLQAQWLPVWVSPEVKGFACVSGNCLVILGGQLSHQCEVSVGPIFRF
jgi:hypothetical protein